MSYWKDGLHKEDGETAYYTRERRFVLRTIQDDVGWKPVWVCEAVRASSDPKPHRTESRTESQEGVSGKTVTVDKREDTKTTPNSGSDSSAARDKRIRKAVEADFLQRRIDGLTPDRGYLPPIDNVRALIKELLREACPECGGTGGVDSGGVNPWGTSITLPCPSCSPNARMAIPVGSVRHNTVLTDMLRTVQYRLNVTAQWTEGVLHTFNNGHAVVENKATAELELVPVCKEMLKFTVIMEQWIEMQVNAQRQAQIQGVAAPNITAIRR